MKNKPKEPMRILTLFVSVLLLFGQGFCASFITREGSQLMLDGYPFNFAGCNTYWVGLDENVGGVNYPTHFRVDDAMATAVEMGARVVRAHTVGISTGNSLSVETTLDTWNEVALDYIDYAIFSASNAGLYLVVPFTDNYAYYHGGKHDFTDWRGLPEDDFYTNDQVIADFMTYIDTLLYHVNNYTGNALKDEPTIMAWETGNELLPPANWTGVIAEHVKSVDTNHLVLDGRYGIDPEALLLDTVDIYSDHYYPMSVVKLQSDAEQVYSAAKVFLVGEYGWSDGSVDFLQSFLEEAEALTEAGKLAGDLYWSLFPHADDYGFVQHDDGFTLHYPGDTEDMASRAQLLREHAYYVGTGSSPPTHNVPPAPLITSISGAAIAWRGAAAAGNYTVQRTEDGATWDTICDSCADDNDTPWVDENAPSDVTLYYRVMGHSLDGVDGPYSEIYKVES